MSNIENYTKPHPVKHKSDLHTNQIYLTNDTYEFSHYHYRVLSLDNAVLYWIDKCLDDNKSLPKRLDELIVDINNLIDNGLINDVQESLILMLDNGLKPGIESYNKRIYNFLKSEYGLKYLYGKINDDIDNSILHIYDYHLLVEVLPGK